MKKEEQNIELDEKALKRKNEKLNTKLIVFTIILVSEICFAVMFIGAFLWVDSKEIAEKPIIYLYPTEETEVTVKLTNKELVKTSYPKYTSAWNVIADKDGKIIDVDTGRKLYSLYYESDNKLNFKVENDGFIVKREDVAAFLEDKLAVLGLNEYEANEFIIYWLPRLEKNKYNYIRFATMEEIDENMPLDITPTPDTVIRVLMTFKGLDKPITITNQELKNIERSGFTVVEWGGIEIK